MDEEQDQAFESLYQTTTEDSPKAKASAVERERKVMVGKDHGYNEEEWEYGFAESGFPTSRRPQHCRRKLLH